MASSDGTWKPSSSSKEYLTRPIRPMEEIFSPEQIIIPPELPGIMKAWTKELIRHQPKDIVEFSFQYFQAINDNDLPEFLKEKAKVVAALDAKKYAAFAKETPSGEQQSGNLKNLPNSPKDTNLEIPGGVVDVAARKREVYEQHFRKFDADGSGAIDTDELVLLLRELGWDDSPEKVKKASDILDADGNGEIELDEFLRWTEFAWQEHALTDSPSSKNKKGGVEFEKTTLDSSLQEADEEEEEEEGE